MDIPWLAALGMMFLLEGIIPFLFPGRWRSIFDRICRLQDGQIRFLGLGAVVVGFALLWLAPL